MILLPSSFGMSFKTSKTVKNWMRYGQQSVLVALHSAAPFWMF